MLLKLVLLALYIDGIKMRKITENILYGLVLAGGESTRMKANKFSLEFHGKMQSVYCYEMLSSTCKKTFISARREQANEEGIEGFPKIYDQAPYVNIGPIGGILSAMLQYPDVDWFVLAVDLPFVTQTTIQNLLMNHDPSKNATVYKSTHDGLPEPLCALYTCQGQTAMKNYVQNGNVCPRKFLINSDIALLEQIEPNSLDNINHPDEYREAIRFFERKKEL